MYDEIQQHLYACFQMCTESRSFSWDAAQKKSEQGTSVTSECRKGFLDLWLFPVIGCELIHLRFYEFNCLVRYTAFFARLVNFSSIFGSYKLCS
jgi:hypothetical protein